MRKAFTLIEVLVSIAIFLIILGIVIVNYGKSQRINEFQLIAFDIEDSMKFTQNFSLTGQKINNKIPTNGYGIILNKTDNTYNIYGDMANYGFESELSDLIYSKNVLDSHVSIKDLVCNVKDGSEIGYSKESFEKLDINFSMPKGLMSIIINRLKNENILSCEIFLSSTKADGNWIINIIPGSGKAWSKFSKN